jgi:hypothetical protein
MIKNHATCQSCIFWDQRYPDNKQLGVCIKIGALIWPSNNELSIHAESPHSFGAPINDYNAVRTTNLFGCVSHDDTEELRTMHLEAYHQEITRQQKAREEGETIDE